MGPPPPTRPDERNSAGPVVTSDNHGDSLYNTTNLQNGEHDEAAGTKRKSATQGDGWVVSKTHPRRTQLAALARS
jgi:hypothetical protein